MTDEQLKAIGEALQSVASTFAEFRRQWHPSMGGVPPFGLLSDCLTREAARIRAQGQEQLADGLLQLRTDAEESANA